MSQIVADPIERYLESLHVPVDDLIEQIGREGRERGLPLVIPASGRFLRAMALSLGARHILEIGTAIGYSALWMAGALPPDGRLISIELDAERAEVARANIARAGKSDQISVIVGDATRYLHKVAGPFDLIFQDSHKQLYEAMLDRLVAMLRPGGVLLSDNVLWNGEVVEGYVDPPQRDGADTAALRAYNKRLLADPRLFTTILSVGDGVAMSVRLHG